MGFITNPAQEKQLRSDDFQNTVVQALVESITRFRDARERAHRRAGAPLMARRIGASSRSSSLSIAALCGRSSASHRGGPAPGPPPARPRRRLAAPAGARAQDQGDAVLRLRGRSVAARRRSAKSRSREPIVEQARRIVEAQLADAAARRYASAIPPARRCARSSSASAATRSSTSAAKSRTNHPGGALDELFTIYAIVNALTVNLPAITRVQILVDGKEVDTLAGHVDLRHPLQKNLNGPQLAMTDTDK